MKKVVSLIEFRYRETIAVLRYLLRLALRGELTGVALCFRANGREEYAFTGDYKADKSAVLHAATRIGWKTNQAIDAMESTF